MTGRPRIALAEPTDDLAGFPGVRCAEDWFRAHTVSAGPWWYAHDGHGRFDLRPPYGTCYLGSHVEAAVRERLGETLARAGVISAVEADRMVVSRLRIDATVADTTDQKATGYGLTRELAAITPYDLPQCWAATFHAAGYVGLRYWPRFSRGADLHAVGLFGPAGADHDRPTDLNPMSGRDACTQADVAVIGLPRRLSTIEPPTRS